MPLPAAFAGRWFGRQLRNGHVEFIYGLPSVGMLLQCLEVKEPVGCSELFGYCSVEGLPSAKGEGCLNILEDSCRIGQSFIAVTCMAK